MSIQNVPGFAPILNAIRQPLPQFLVTYFVRSAPYLILSVATLMSYNDFFRATSERPSLIMGLRDPPESYDFIIVGGGTSGSVIASRLANLPEKYRVLLLEAGGDPHPLSYVPAFGSSLYNKPQVDWEYHSRPLNDSGRGTASSDGSLNYPRSRSLGGSTNVNDMIYMRGNPHDYDIWGVTSGDFRWGYNNVQKYFKEMEDYHGHWETTEENDHGVGGPVHIEKAGFSKGVHHWLEAGAELGLKSNVDPNAKHQSDGLFQLDMLAKNGVRHGTYRAYLENELRFKQQRQRRFRFGFMGMGRRRNRQEGQNSNLVVHRYSVVTHIDIEQGQDGNGAEGVTTRNEQKRAVGVTYFRHAVKQYARAEKEIILAAGAINTPKLLLLSGVGPLEELQSIGIDQVAELPVGKENLQDHVSTIVGPFLLNSSESFLPTRDLSVSSAADYISQGAGPFSVPNLVTGGGLISTQSSPLTPNILLTLIGSGTDDILERQLVETYSLNQAKLSTYLQNNAKKDSNYVVVTLGKPKSRGSVRVGSFDPWHHPHIDLNYFSDPLGLDVKDLIEGVQWALSLFEKTDTYQKLGAELTSEKYPGCEEHELRSDAYYECLIRTVTVTLSNPCCTAPMGIKGDPKAVVDSELKVIGINGLRIADASIMPEIPNAQITAPTIMIGEVVSDLISNEWASTSSSTAKVKTPAPKA